MLGNQGWCYDCRYVRVTCYGFWCNYYCCDEDGKEYKWTRPAFLRFGTHMEGPTPKTSVDELEETGDCEGYVEPQPLPDEGHYVPEGPGPTPEGRIGGVVPGIVPEKDESKKK